MIHPSVTAMAGIIKLATVPRTSWLHSSTIACANCDAQVMFWIGGDRIKRSLAAGFAASGGIAKRDAVH
jgi:hypothetical protein